MQLTATHRNLAMVLRHPRGPNVCQEWLQRLFIPDEDDPFSADRAEDLPYRIWGFTINRTSYARSSEPQWEHLVQKIQSELKAADLTNSHQDRPDFQIIMKLFSLDTKSDASTLAGLDINQLRDLHKSNNAGHTMCGEFSRATKACAGHNGERDAVGMGSYRHIGSRFATQKRSDNRKTVNVCACIRLNSNSNQDKHTQYLVAALHIPFQRLEMNTPFSRGE